MITYLRSLLPGCSWLAALLLCPVVASAHSGDSVPAPGLSSAPVFETSGRNPQGCNALAPNAYSKAAHVSIDGDVTVFILHTGSDLYFCFVGIEVRNSTPLTEPNHKDTAWVYLDVDHSGSTQPTKSHYLFEISPTSLITVSAASLSGPQFHDPGPPQDSGPPKFTEWSARGVDSASGEFLVAWNAELRIGKALLGSSWHTVGLRLAYNVGIPFVTHKVGMWPQDSKPLDPSTWGDLILSDSGGGVPTGILTNNADNARTGSYFESTLNPSNVIDGSNFGKLHTWEVEGQIYAQPLYVHGLVLPDGRTRNVVFVATEKNHVYALDADTFEQLWHVDLGVPVPSDEVGCNDHKNLEPYVGITSTPAIDLGLNSIYVVAKSKAGGDYYQSLHMLDLPTGQDRREVFIFRGEQALRQLNRPGLLLSNGKVYVAFGSHCDNGNYHGWVFAYDARTLVGAGEFNTTPTGNHGSIWQAGRGLAADQAGNIFFMTGNGDVASDSNGNRTDFSQSFVRLDPTLKNPDWWTDPDWNCFNKPNDLDLGSSGPLLLTAPTGNLVDNRVIGGGKAGEFYLFNAMSLGHNANPMDKIMATTPPHFMGQYCLTGTPLYTDHTHHIHGGPVSWDRTGAGGDILVYNMGEEDHLKAFLITRNRTAFLGPHAMSKYQAPENSMPGGILSLSHSDSAGSGLVWALHPLKDDANEHIVKGMLTVFEATPTTCLGGNCTSGVFDLRLLWHSQLNPRDDVGLLAKFAPATVAEGKVFVASFGDPGWSDAKTRSGWLHEYAVLTTPH
jgi:outer membrane protein assembly factor BamB